MKLNDEERKALERLLGGGLSLNDIVGKLRDMLADSQEEESRVAKHRWSQISSNFPTQTRCAIEKQLVDGSYRRGCITEDIKELLVEEMFQAAQMAEDFR